MNALLAAATALSSIAALALMAWSATLPSWRTRLGASASIALLAWLLWPLAVETGLRDLARWLGEFERARELAALATLDGMLGLALTGRALWGTASQAEQALLRWLPPLTTPCAVFAFCVFVSQSDYAIDFGVLRSLVATVSLALLLIVGALIAAAMTARTARLELRLAASLLILAVAGWLAAIPRTPPTGVALSVDVVALGLLLCGALLILFAGFLRGYWRSGR